MNKIKLFIPLLVLVLLTACKSTPKQTYYDSTFSDDDTDTATLADNEQTSYEDTPGNVVSVPFVEKGGVKFVEVSVNGMGVQMIFDTGCSGTLISVAEARYLYEKGALTENDFKGVTQAQIADGSIVENMVINLKEVVIGDKIQCTDVEATVSANTQAPLLLGNEVLNRVAAYAIDNENKVINFKIR